MESIKNGTYSWNEDDMIVEYIKSGKGLPPLPRNIFSEKDADTFEFIGKSNKSSKQKIKQTLLFDLNETEVLVLKLEIKKKGGQQMSYGKKKKKGKYVFYNLTEGEILALEMRLWDIRHKRKGIRKDEQISKIHDQRWFG